jgi:hypothetical protein
MHFGGQTAGHIQGENENDALIRGEENLSAINVAAS